ncbi:MAG: phosphatase PAP2 family protein [Thermoleophilaceae bacterium]|nr:phosphatase PAP2 family protein [Thermoleophilaceae bacterium]
MLYKPRTLLFLAAGSAALFVLVLLGAYAVGPIEWIDGAALEGFVNLRGPRMDWLAERSSALANEGPFALFTLAIVLVAYARRGPRYAAAIGIVVPLAALSSQILKPLLAHERPHDFLGSAQIAVAAFPSGHATASMTLALAAVLVAPRAWRPLVAVGAAVFTLGVSFSLLILGWHFPSDVVGGYLLAVTYALVFLAGLRHADARWPERTGRDVARRVLDPNEIRAGWTAALAAAAVLALTALTLVLGRLPAAADFARDHTSAVIGAAAVAGAGAAVVAAVLSLTTSRRR